MSTVSLSCWKTVLVVDRANHASAVRNITEAAVRKIRGQVIFFVEGTRTRTGHLLPFKKGAFYFAIDRQLPILPAAIRGSYSVLAKLPWWRLRPGREIDILFGRVIAPPRLRDGDTSTAVEGLLQATRTEIAAGLSAE